VPPVRAGLRFAHFKPLRGTPTQWVLQETLAALGAQVKPFFAISIVAQESAILIELVVAFEHFGEVFQVVAIFVNSNFIRSGRGVHFHLYDKARFMLRIDLTLAKVANVTNHLATILS
jgi:hypothetical protein